MKKAVKKVSVVEATKSRVDVEFIRSSVLPEDKAIRVAALLAGVSERAVRRQLKRINRASSEA